jgi:hypothetical protein
MYTRSARAHDQVHAAVRLDDVADLAYVESVCRALERLLHLSGPEPAEVAGLLVRRAVRVLLRKRAERVCAPVDLRLVTTQDLDRLLLAARYVLLQSEIEISTYVEDEEEAQQDAPPSSSMAGASLHA